MGVVFKSWLSSNWYSIIGLLFVLGTFYVSTQKIEWRVTKLEENQIVSRADINSGSASISEIKGTLAVISSKVSTIADDIKDVKIALRDKK